MTRDSLLGCVRVTLSMSVQPLLSVMVNVYVPALRLLIVSLEALYPGPFQLKVYLGVPPPGVGIIEPSLPPKQLI